MNKLEIHHRFDTPLRLLVETPEPMGTVRVTAIFDGVFAAQSEGFKMAYTLQNGKRVQLKVEFMDADGNHATVDGDPRWSSSNGDIASVSAAPGNPYLADLTGVNVGNAQVIVEADADLGGGIREIICTLDVSIVAGEAVVGVITPSGEPSNPSPGGP